MMTLTICIMTVGAKAVSYTHLRSAQLPWEGRKSNMAIKDRMSGNEAVATAMRQINPDVMGAFPITPSTEIPQYFSKYIADGKVDTEFVAVESEHSAMSRCV